MNLTTSTESIFLYEACIVASLTKLYRQDYDILDVYTHEQTCTFRLAHYLAERLEPSKSGLYVDCEYHRDRFRDDCRKTVEINGQSIRFRPDIIYHDRNHQNEFCIEFKKYSPRGDIQKVRQMVHSYAYSEGYSICNIHSDRVTVYCVNRRCTVKRVYRYSISEQILRIHSSQIQ